MPITDFANVSFGVEDGHLVMRAVARSTGKPYRHACPRADLEAVAHALDQARPDGLTRESLHEATGLPWTRLNVAVLFLFERSIVERAGRRGARYVPACAGVHLDAMTEYHALCEPGA